MIKYYSYHFFVALLIGVLCYVIWSPEEAWIKYDYTNIEILDRPDSGKDGLATIRYKENGVTKTEIRKFYNCECGDHYRVKREKGKAKFSDVQVKDLEDGSHRLWNGWKIFLFILGPIISIIALIIKFQEDTFYRDDYQEINEFKVKIWGKLFIFFGFDPEVTEEAKNKILMESDLSSEVHVFFEIITLYKNEIREINIRGNTES